MEILITQDFETEKLRTRCGAYFGLKIWEPIILHISPGYTFTQEVDPLRVFLQMSLM